jgi:peptide methionine sulfoxide reductase MsrA
LTSNLQSNFKSIEYEKNAFNYLKNAEENLGKNELSKAGECLWGAVAEFVKAIAILSDHTANSHKKLRRIAYQLGLQKEMKIAEKLHVNYYENFLDKEEFFEYYEKIQALIKKLQNILYEHRKYVL